MSTGAVGSFTPAAGRGTIGIKKRPWDVGGVHSDTPMSTNTKTSGLRSELTALPVAVGCGATLKPEWVKLPAAVAYSGIGRSSLYELIAENKLRSAVIRKSGNSRGMRVVSVASIDAYLNGLADADAAQR